MLNIVHNFHTTHVSADGLVNFGRVMNVANLISTAVYFSLDTPKSNLYTSYILTYDYRVQKLFYKDFKSYFP